jgi:heme/copper-type cytochrome/quinol oxidase subunit 2
MGAKIIQILDGVDPGFKYLVFGIVIVIIIVMGIIIFMKWEARYATKKYKKLSKKNKE